LPVQGVAKRSIKAGMIIRAYEQEI
jgi:hypothetical protein